MRKTASNKKKTKTAEIPWIVDWVNRNRINGQVLEDVINRCVELKCDAATIKKLQDIKAEIKIKTDVEKRLATKKIKEGKAELTPAEIRVMADVLKNMVQKMTPKERKRLKDEVDDAIKWGDIKL